MRQYYYDYDDATKKKVRRYYPPRQKSASLPMVNLEVPYCEQGRRSANCGPCAVKMMLDYYHIIDPKKNALFSLQSVNRYLKVSSIDGVYTDVINSFFKRFNHPLHHVSFDQIVPVLRNGQPILAFFLDEVFDAHYAVICGFKDLDSSAPVLIFQDPWPDFGVHYERFLADFYEQCEAMNFWLFTIR